MRSRLVSLAVLAFGALSCSPPQPATLRAATSIQPRDAYCGESDCWWLFEPGACQAMASWLSIPGQFSDVRLELPVVGHNSTAVDGETYTVELQSDLTTFDWTATAGVDFVIATNVVDSNVYEYAPKATADTGLTAYAGNPLTLVLFCQKAELAVSTTATGGVSRTHSWSISKSSPSTSVTAPVGAAVDVAYVVTVDAATLDAASVVTGTITVQNPFALDVTGVALQASYAGAAVTPDCGAFGGTLAAGATLTCTWSAQAASFDGAAVVTVSAGGIPSASASSPVTSRATITSEVDRCVDVTDDQVGALGVVCADAAPARFAYTLPAGPYATCDATGTAHSIVNVASFAAPSGASGSSSFTVAVLVPCPASSGCTLTQGYWKTHSRQGPAPYDETWSKLGAEEENTIFFRSGQTWLQVFRTAVRGNAYYTLAHQYMAARLNVLAGADAAAVAAELAWATRFFEDHTPAMGFRPSVAPTMIATAGALARFNEGAVGPGHCE